MEEGIIILTWDRVSVVTEESPLLLSTFQLPFNFLWSVLSPSVSLKTGFLVWSNMITLDLLVWLALPRENSPDRGGILSFSVCSCPNITL